MTRQFISSFLFLKLPFSFVATSIDRFPPVDLRDSFTKKCCYFVICSRGIALHNSIQVATQSVQRSEKFIGKLN